MDANFESFLQTQNEEFKKFRKALSTESDRGCALFAAAYLDVSLGQLLRCCMVQNKKVDEELFKGQAPLSTFSARIKMAYYMGLLSQSERADLEIMRSVRNEFAHHPEYLDFEVQSIRDRCGNLTHHWHEDTERARAKFTGSVSALLALIHVQCKKVMPFVERAERPISEEMKVKIRVDAKRMAEEELETTLAQLKSLHPSS